MNNNHDGKVKTWKCKRKLTEDEVVEICKSLVMNNGSIIDTYNDMIADIDVISSDRIQSIKYKKAWVEISDIYFTADTFDIKQLNFLDCETVELICEILLKYNGIISSVMKELADINPNITRNNINGIKYKLTWTDISDKYFTADIFDIKQQNRLDKETVELICELLIKHNGSMTKVMKELVDINPNITIGNINGIRYKTKWTKISDKYFDESLFETQREENIKLVCETLVKYNGSTTKTFNELKLKSEDFRLKDIENIRYKNAWRKISDEYFKSEDFKK